MPARSSYFGAIDGKWAFVTTNSITQGEASHRSSARSWSRAGRSSLHTEPSSGHPRRPARPRSTASSSDSSAHPDSRRLFDYATVDSGPVEVAGVKNISPYLTDSVTVIVDPATQPLSPQMGEVAYGNKPTDGGWLIVERRCRRARPGPTRSRRSISGRYVGARELLHGGERHCLWLVDSTPAERRASPFVSERVAKASRVPARQRRLLPHASTRRQAHLFRQIAQPTVPYLCIPAHVSENRPYFLAAHFPPDVITSNANFLSEDAERHGLRGDLVAHVHGMAAGRRRANQVRPAVQQASVVEHLPSARAFGWGSRAQSSPQEQACSQRASPWLAFHLQTCTRPKGSIRTAGGSRQLDRAVDSAFGLKVDHGATELERQDILFARYQELASGLLASFKQGHGRRRARGSRA